MTHAPIHFHASMHRRTHVQFDICRPIIYRLKNNNKVKQNKNTRNDWSIFKFIFWTIFRPRSGIILRYNTHLVCRVCTREIESRSYLFLYCTLRNLCVCTRELRFEFFYVLQTAHPPEVEAASRSRKICTEKTILPLLKRNVCNPAVQCLLLQ